MRTRPHANPRYRIMGPATSTMARGVYPRREEAAADLAVTCWCERKVVKVPAVFIRAGVTSTCGRFDCQPAELAA